MRNLLRGKGFYRFLLISVLFIFMASWAEGATTWITETVDSEGNVGRQSSVAVDSRGNVHISYYDATNGALKYATNSSGSWVTETVDSGDAGSLTIPYCSNDLFYNFESVDSEDVVGSLTSIAVDSSGKVHISYSRDSECYYHYTLYDGYDDEGTMRVRGIKYATNASGSWVTEAIASHGLVGYDISIAVDSSDNVHIVYSRYLDFGSGVRRKNLTYVTNASGSWVSETVAGSTGYYLGYLGYVSIAVDSSDKVHISYSVGDSYGQYFSLKIAKYATNASGLWIVTSLDAGRSTSIAVDSLDNVHISYYRYVDFTTVNDLTYATNASGSWVMEIVDRGSRYYTSIALDSRDNVRISYYDATDDNLKYATDASGLWVTETIDRQ